MSLAPLQDNNAVASVRANTSTCVDKLMHAFPHTFTASHLLNSLLRGQQMEKRGRCEEAQQNIINAGGPGPLATSVPLTGVTCLPNKQATHMSEERKWLT